MIRTNKLMVTKMTDENTRAGIVEMRKMQEMDEEKWLMA